MGKALRVIACASALAAASLPVSVDAVELCKNHYILDEPIVCTWQRMASLNLARAWHTATLLRDGSVLVTGGATDLHSVERYDPVANTWRVVAPMIQRRGRHVATLLADGRVFVIGGEDFFFGREIDTPEVYDPVADRWTLTAPPPSWWQRVGFRLTLLQDGRVLLSGGVDFEGGMMSSEIYDPRLDAWSPAGVMNQDRYGHSATALADGRVLVAGGVEDDFLGRSSPATEVYLAETGQFALGARLANSRAAHEATLLADGNVMVSGGWQSYLRQNGWMGFRTMGSIEIYDVGAGAWQPGPDLQVPRYAHTVTRLPSGSLLMVGGVRSFGNVPGVTYTTLHSTELRTDAGAPSFAVGELNDARAYHTATLLHDGTVLVVGGAAGGKALASVERFGAPSTP